MTDQALLNSKFAPFGSFRASSPLRNSVTSQNKENYPIENTNLDSHHLETKIAKKTSVPSTMQKRRLSESIPIPPSYLAEVNSRNSVSKMSEREHFDLSNEDPKLLYQEILSLKKALGESQARAVLATKELSKIQYENATLQLQTKKAEAKCKDMIDQHSTSQVKLNEVTFLNSKLNAELMKLRMNAQENSTEAREEFQRLKKSLGEIEEMMQMKNKKIFSYTISAKKFLETLNDLFEGSENGLPNKCYSMFQQSKEFIEKILKILDSNNFVSKIHSEEANVVKTLNQVIHTYEAENIQLTGEIARLKTFADREIEQEKVVSQYKASIEKLREAVTAVRGKLKELQSNKEAEKEYYENKLQKIQQTRDKLLEENTNLKDTLSSYETRLKEAGDLINLLRENMDTPLPPQESFKPTNQITERRMPLKTKEEEVTPIRASTRGSLGSRAKVSRGWSGDEKRNETKDSRFTTPLGCLTHNDQIPMDSFREKQQNEDLLERMKSFRRKVEQNTEEDVRRPRSVKAAKGLKKEITSLDSEIIQLEKCIRQELASNANSNDNFDF